MLWTVVVAGWLLTGQVAGDAPAPEAPPTEAPRRRAPRYRIYTGQPPSEQKPAAPVPTEFDLALAPAEADILDTPLYEPLDWLEPIFAGKPFGDQLRGAARRIALGAAGVCGVIASPLVCGGYTAAVTIGGAFTAGLLFVVLLPFIFCSPGTLVNLFTRQVDMLTRGFPLAICFFPYWIGLRIGARGFRAIQDAFTSPEPPPEPPLDEDEEELFLEE